MANEPGQEPIQSQPAVYQIRIMGRLGCQWRTWFEGMAIRGDENGDTLITGIVADQAALYGLLRKVRDTGLQLVSVNRLADGQADSSESIYE